MDLEPYSRINPCGYAGLKTVDLSTIGVCVAWPEAAQMLSQKLATYLTPDQEGRRPRENRDPWLRKVDVRLRGNEKR